jgi:putative phosphoribosyl transferase
MQAASTALREQHPAQLIIALPVIARTTRETVERLSDEIVCAAVQPPDQSLLEGIWYENSRQPTEAETRNMISELSHSPSPSPAETKTNGA